MDRRLILLSLLIFLLTSSAGCRVLVVDGAGTGNFKTLESAVASSQEWDTIIIKNGSYRENVVLTRPLTIRGEGGCSISGLGKNVFSIKSQGCALANMTILGSGPEAAVIIESANNTVEECTIKDCATGIRMLGGLCNVTGCTIQSTASGIQAGPVSRIYGNVISGGLGSGVSLVRAKGASVRSNTIGNCNAALDMTESNGTLLEANLLHSSNIGARAVRCSDMIMVNNTCRQDQIAGIYLESSSKNVLAGNLLKENGNGILLKYSPGNNISSNVAITNQFGISLKGSGGNALRGNVLEQNQYNLRVETGEVSDMALIASPASDRSFDGSYQQDLDSSNTADGRPICYLVGGRDMVVPAGCGAIFLVGCQNVTANDQNISNSSVGLLAVNCSHCTFERCNFTKSEVGLTLLASSDCKVIDVASSKCKNGFWVARSTGSLLQRAAANLSLECGFRLEGDRSITLDSCQAHGNPNGISLLDSLSCKIIRCLAGDNKDRGIRLIRSHKAELEENTAYGNGHGITLSGSNSCRLYMNCASGNKESGLLMEQLTIAHLLSNRADGNREGAFIQSAVTGEIRGNVMSGNTRYGIRMSTSSGFNITENLVSENELAGIGLIDCKGNTIYHNNLIDNGKSFANNAVDNGENLWDRGPKIGGNYWSDHQTVGNPGSTPKKIPSTGIDRYPFQEADGWQEGPIYAWG